MISNELSTPKVLVCPSDERSAQTNFSMQVGDASTVQGQYFNNWEVSYFLGIDASENNPQMILAGDRNIYGQGPGQAALPLAVPNNGYGALQNSAVALGNTFLAGVATPCLDRQNAPEERQRASVRRQHPRELSVARPRANRLQ